MTPPTVAGALLAICAFVLWGLFPIYWKQLVDVAPLEVLSHRVIWSVPFVGVVIVLGRKWTQFISTLRDPKRLLVLAMTSCLISLNWGVYIWAMGVDKVVEASMGYFLTPLFNVIIGLILFREKLHRLQWAGVLIAASGVIYLFFAKGVPPWIALLLGLSFAAYGALRKQATQDSVTGLFMETLVIAPVALLYLLIFKADSGPGFLHGALSTDLYLIGAGVITATPLLLFVAGAKRLHYSTVGLLFYLTPSIQFLIGTLIYEEPLLHSDFVAFVCIWLALALFAAHGYIDSRRPRPH